MYKATHLIGFTVIYPHHKCKVFSSAYSSQNVFYVDNNNLDKGHLIPDIKIPNMSVGLNQI